jgi:hypothetical protein
MKAWTDYPFTELGDTAGEIAPVRMVEVLSYDGDKYCKVCVNDVYEEIKTGYLYTQPGRYGEVPKITRRQLECLK